MTFHEHPLLSLQAPDPLSPAGQSGVTSESSSHLPALPVHREAAGTGRAQVMHISSLLVSWSISEGTGCMCVAGGGQGWGSKPIPEYYPLHIPAP